jgi:colanic acid biosynthesis glycosyl transferase WcaI
MRVLFVNQYYWPDSAATAQLLADLGAQLVEAGHEVHVLCARGVYAEGSRAGGRLPLRERHEGVEIHRVPTTSFAKRTPAGRLIDYMSCHVGIGVATLAAARRFDVVVTLTTPPLIGIYATLASVRSRSRHVCWVMDLHPDCEFELGLMDRRAWGPRLLDALNGLHFRRAAVDVVLGGQMGARLVEKGVPPERIRVIPNWADLGGEAEHPAAGSFREELGIGDEFVVMYSGNAGLLHSFDAICAAMAALRDDPRFVFLFVGGGGRLAEIRAFVQEQGLERVHFQPYQPRERLADSLAAGDCHLISLRNGMAGVAVPSKLYGIMAAARPTVFVGPADSETADSIREADCGYVVDPDDADSLVRVLREMAGDAELCRRMGENALDAHRRLYTAEVCGAQWRTLLEAVAAGETGGE